MSAATTLFAGTTAIQRQFLNTVEMDQVIVCATGSIGTETIAIEVMDTAGTAHAVVNPFTGAVYALVGGTNDTVVLPGGYLYRINKPITVGAVGIDYFIKPRIC